MRKQLLGESHPDMATGLDNLAVLYSNQRRYEETKILSQEALKIAEVTLGINHSNTNVIRENLRSLLIITNSFDQN